MTKSIFDQTIFILENTNDGDNLSPNHLKLIEIAANKDLSEAGEVALSELYRNVKTGYTQPWFLGIENLTRDHEGYVYWKNKQVEHYDHDHWCSEGWQERMFQDAKELERRCKILEGVGLPVNTISTAWSWPEIAQTLGVFKELEPIAV